MPDYKEFDGEAVDSEELIDFMDENNTILCHQNKYGGMNLIMANLPYVYDSLVAGHSIKSICDKLGVNRRSWYHLRDKSSNFMRLLELAEREQIDCVKGSLVSKATDKFVTAQKVLSNGKIVDYKKYVPANISAIKFYLLNKASDEFQDKQTVEVRKQEIIIDLYDDESEEVDS